jgi:protein TonB
MATLLILCLFTLVCLFLASGRAWSNETEPVRNALVFAGRNRSYGAYRLREDYPKRVGLAVLGALGLLALVAALPRIMGHGVPATTCPLPTTDLVVDVDLTRLWTQPAPMPQAAKPRIKDPAPPSQPKTATLGPVEADSTATTTPTPPDTATWVRNTANSGNSNSGTDSSATSGTSMGGSGMTATSATYNSYEVQELPEFPGGMEAMEKWVRQNLEFPENFSGKDAVFVQFTVDAEGNVRDVKAVRSRQEASKRAAERAIRRMPRWRAARMNGHAVSCRLVLPIKFETR